MILEAIARWTVYVPALGVLGLIGATRLVQRHSGSGAIERSEDSALRRWSFACGVALLVAVLLRAVVQTIAAFGVEGLTVESLRAVAVESRWGGRWQWQLGAAVLVSIAHAALLRWRAVTPIAGLASVGFVWTLPLTGHAFGHAWAWIAQSLHGMGAGLWIGTLALLAVARRAPPRTDETEDLSRRRLVDFAPFATTGAATLALTGAFLAWRQLPTFDALWAAPWGRTLLLKVGLVGIALGLGALNHRRLRREDSAPVTGSIRAELLVALLVLAATGWLSSSSPPMEG